VRRGLATRGLVAVLLCLAALPAPAEAYLHLAFTLTGGRIDVVRWRAQPRWFATDRSVAGVSASAFQATLARAFATWAAVPTATIDFQFVGFTSAEPFDDDGIAVLGFRDEPGMDRVLGATGFTVDLVSGDIVEADVFFNAAFPWSTAAAGDPARFDLESVAVHEIGHFVGLGHSALGETEVLPTGGRRVLGSGSVMFPISLGRGSIADRVLQPDDVAAVSSLYPADGFESSTGIITGRVTRNGSGVLGAHVVAFAPDTGALVGGFTQSADGSFEIRGLRPGAYVVRVEPLDDADVGSFFDSAAIDVSFRVVVHPRLVAAPRGGAGEAVVLAVPPK